MTPQADSVQPSDDYVQHTLQLLIDLYGSETPVWNQARDVLARFGTRPAAEPKGMEKVRAAIDEYKAALARREHGDVAAHQAIYEIIEALAADQKGENEPVQDDKEVLIHEATAIEDYTTSKDIKAFCRAVRGYLAREVDAARVRDEALAEAVQLHESEEVLAPVGNSAWGEARQEGWIDGTKAYRDAIRALIGTGGKLDQSGEGEA